MNVVISHLGTTLDAHGRKTEERWEVWRPNVALALQPDLKVDVFYLIYDPRFSGLFKAIRADIQKVSPETTVVGVKILFVDAWDFEEVYAKLYDFACGEEIRKRIGEDDFFIHISTGTHVAQICMFLLNESHHLPGKLVQTRPVSANCRDASLRARGEVSLIDLDLSQYDQLAKRFEGKRQEDLSFLKSGIATRNGAFNHLIEQIERVAIRSTEPILLMGPTGAGKSQLARRIYELKRTTAQVKGAFVEVNCATLRGDQAASTLFGHKKGSFTGALSDRLGLLKTADGGILFLDEVGELGLDEQAMLLRAIEDKTFLPLGSDKEVSSSFQLICGTNRELGTDCDAGRFRSDLLARIDLWTFSLPGLAERREDIEPNLEYELNRLSMKEGKLLTFNAEARKRFLDFALDPATLWKGNFRDLNAMVTRMATLATGGRIDLGTVEEEIARCRTSPKRPSGPSGVPSGAEEEGMIFLRELLGMDVDARYDAFDLAQLARVVAVCRTSTTLAEAGKRLFAVSRLQRKSANDSDRLRKYLARFGLSFAQLH